MLTLEATRPPVVGGATTAGPRFGAPLPALAAFAPVCGLAAAQGGYFPTAWGWASVPLLWATAVTVSVRSRLRLSRLELVFLGALAAVVGWTALSVAWSAAPAASVLEIERALVYVGAAGAVLTLARARSARNVLAGLLTAIVLVSMFSLATRLAPDHIGVYDGSGVYRLAEPIGYWNGLSLFAAMGALLAVGFAGRARRIATRALCGAVLVPLAVTVYFTFGRAAWLAIAVGLLVMLAVDPRRMHLLAVIVALAPAPAAAVFLASRERALTHPGSPLALAAHDGHRLGAVILVLAATNAAVAAVLVLLESRMSISRRVARTFGAAVAVAVLAAAAGGLVRYGGPVHIARHAYRSFTAPLPNPRINLNQRFRSFSGNGRAQMWQIAWDDATRHPVLGAGAGTYERYFLAHQPANVIRVHDAHSLYMETLAELGPVGLGILVVALAAPLAALRRARTHPLAPAAAGAYVAYLVHAGVDWDWELPAVTLVGLLCGAAILLNARAAGKPWAVSGKARVALAAGAVAAAFFALVGIIGNTALSRSQTARQHGNLAAASTDARTARLVMPWSPAPWQALGRAQLAAGLAGDARASFRKAISIDSGDWELWHDLAGVTTGSAHAHAIDEVRALYPRSGAGGPN
jgi:hypothetical protein